MTNKRRIKERRKQLGMSQEELADLVGTNQSQISMYENDRNDPTGEVLIAMAHALDTTIDYLLGLTDNPERPLRSEHDLDAMEKQAIEILRSKPVQDRQKVIDILKIL